MPAMGSLQSSSLLFDGELLQHKNGWMGRRIVGVVGWIVYLFSSPLALSFVGTGVFFSSHSIFLAPAIFFEWEGRTMYQQSPPLAI
jgi:hypothetical protein